MNLRRTVSTATGIFILLTLALIAGGLIVWQGKVAEAEDSLTAQYLSQLEE